MGHKHTNRNGRSGATRRNRSSGPLLQLVEPASGGQAAGASQEERAANGAAAATASLATPAANAKAQQRREAPGARGNVTRQTAPTPPAPPHAQTEEGNAAEQSFVVTAAAPPSPQAPGAARQAAERAVTGATPARTERAPAPAGAYDDDEDTGEIASVGAEPGPDVRGEVGPLIDSLRELFTRDRSVASQGDARRCGVCYLHFPLAELTYREAEGYYVCAGCARSLGRGALPMVRRQQR